MDLSINWTVITLEYKNRLHQLNKLIVVGLTIFPNHPTPKVSCTATKAKKPSRTNTLLAKKKKKNQEPIRCILQSSCALFIYYYFFFFFKLRSATYCSSLFFNKDISCYFIFSLLFFLLVFPLFLFMIFFITLPAICKLQTARENVTEREREQTSHEENKVLLDEKRLVQCTKANKPLGPNNLLNLYNI